MNDLAVKRATGKDWKEWFEILDRENAKDMKHGEIAKILNEKYLTKKEWWGQMITVEYERARGLRKVNETVEGFGVAVHKTVEGTMADLQTWWAKIVQSKAVEEKELEAVASKTKRAMLRYRSVDGDVYVYFDERGKGKARIMVETVKMKRQGLVEPVRVFWKDILDRV